MKLLVFLFLVTFLLSAGGARVVHKVTPIEKVIELLEKMRDETEAEGQQEAKDYDEFACFCKEQADNKFYAIGKSKEKIEAQTAKIEMLDAEIADLNGKIKALHEHKDQLENEQKEADETRASEFATYSEAEKELARTVSIVEGAIDALEESKEGMSDAKLNFAQIRTAIKKAVGRTSTVDPKRLEAFLSAFDTEMSTSDKPHAYKYKSNDIISTLKGLLKQFKQDKVKLDTDEADIRNAYELAKQAKENTIKFTEEDIDEKNALEQDKSKEKQQIEQAKKEETDDMNADQAFLDELTTKCQDKAKTFDQRSNARVAELTAVAKALDILKSGVQPNYDANGKLTMLIQQRSVSSKSKVEPHVERETLSAMPDKEISFVQLRKLTNGPSKAGLEALTYLTRKANFLESPTLSMLAVKVQLELGKDHFVKVRAMIKDLIEKLEADAESEKSQQGFCTENMAKATGDRDAAIGKVETLTANIDQQASTIAKLIEEIDELGNSVADLRKSLYEQSELRKEEKATNEKTIEDSTAGLSAVDGAIKVLKKFYEGAFVQQKFVPAGADREGNTVADLAPDTASEEYHGNQDAAKGIFGLLEVIKSDFERTIETTTADEENAEKEFEDFTATTKADIDEKEKSKKENEKKKTGTESDLVDSKDQLKDAQNNLADAKRELEDLKPLCVDTGMDWEERRARQKQEIEALKEALDILSEM